MTKKIWTLMSFMLIAALMLVACGTPAATETPAEPVVTEEAVMTEEAVVTEEAVMTEETVMTEEPAMTEEAAATEEPMAEEMTITIWHQWDGTYLDAITQAFRDYEAENPGVTIDLSKPEDTANALSVAIPAGEGPDIIGWANDQIGTQALAGNIVPLGDYGIDQAFLESTYEPAAVNGVMYANQIWALPESQEGIALVYNTDLVTEEYLPADAMDFEGLLAAAEKFQADTGNVLVCNQGWGNQDAYHVAPIFFGFGVPTYVDEEGMSYMDSPEALAAAEWMVKMREFSLAENTYDICSANFAEGKVGMWWTGPWAIAGIEEAGINYEIIPMGRPFVGIKTLMMTKNAVDRGHAEVALDIMTYFTSPEVQTQIALTNKTIPAPSGALQNPEVAALPTLAGFGQALAEGVPMSSSPFAGAQWVPVGDASIALWNGTQAPEEAMNATQQAIQDAVAEMQ